MSAKIIIEITNGKLAGTKFEFDEHDTFIFGRHKRECHAAIPGDQFVSRHHFILEVNPPDAQLRDLGSLSGTLVNGIKHGGREIHETPQEGAKRFHPPVPLHHGDLICVGDTTMRFAVELPATPPTPQKDGGRTPTVVIPVNRLRVPTVIHRILLCQQCDKNVADEVAPGRTGDYVCNNCRQQIASDPMRHLKGLVQAAAQQEPSAAAVTIPGYNIREKLGQGGMGVVYRAESVETGAEVAVKIMLSQIAVDSQAKRAFLRECGVLGSLAHPNIVRLIETDSSGSAFYFVMDYCSGGSLGDWAKNRRHLDVRKIGPLILQTLSGLAHAHQQGFVHRDIKPQNILLHRVDQKWKAKLGDFGLAKNFQKAGFSGMTATGSYAGTYHFMPKEQLLHYKQTQPVSDIWSLGATFYHLLTGEFPRGNSPDRPPEEVVINGTIIPVRNANPKIPRDIAKVIDRAVAADPQDRFQSAGQMHRALSAALSRER